MAALFVYTLRTMVDISGMDNYSAVVGWFSQFLGTPRTVFERLQTCNGPIVTHRIHIPTCLFHCVETVVFWSVIPNHYNLRPFRIRYIHNN